MRATELGAWTAAALLAVVVALTADLRITDGDSCIYGALAHEMAESGRAAWVAPHWGIGATWTCFHEHPPGAAWLAAVVQLAGAPAPRAAIVAGALWQFAALTGVVAVARRFVTPHAAGVAGALYLLHLPVLRDVARFSLEAPLAACTAWSVACALRLANGRRWAAGLAVALAGAFLVRGVFGCVALGVMAFVLVHPALRPPAGRAMAGVAAAALALIAFDRLHAAAAGHGFWAAYLERQVLPSLVEGGTAHSGDARPFGYFVGRFLLASLPWSLLAVWRLVRDRGRPDRPEAWLLAAAWAVLTLVGALATTRPASRYLFAAVPAFALVATLAVADRVTVRWGRAAWAAVVLGGAAGLLVKQAIEDRDARWEAAVALDEFRAADSDPRPVVVPFPPESDSTSSFLRFHLRVPILGAGAQAAGATRRWVPAGRIDADAGPPLVATIPGTLCTSR